MKVAGVDRVHAGGRGGGGGGGGARRDSPRGGPCSMRGDHVAIVVAARDDRLISSMVICGCRALGALVEHDGARGHDSLMTSDAVPCNAGSTAFQAFFLSALLTIAIRTRVAIRSARVVVRSDRRDRRCCRSAVPGG